MSDINKSIKKYRSLSNAVLLDVRTLQEYLDGHIPDSRNVPVQVIERVCDMVENKSTPLFVYCRSGARSRTAARLLKNMGYDNVMDIGGINAYSGRID
ncbi:MAG: rhodanese-like domain-containing protein [Oscillospiraceae bacterium]|nr:rhodanese-like domain-containing protein [Oscillospiraceae bacterium]